MKYLLFIAGLFVILLNSCGGSNNPPVLISKSPLEKDVDVWAFEGTEFSIVAEDPEGKDLIYEWFVNGVTAGNTTVLNFVKEEKEVGNNYEILCKISDKKNTISILWNARVVSPLYYLKEMSAEFSEAFTTAYYRGTVLNKVSSITSKNIEIYKGNDYNNNGLDDYNDIHFTIRTIRGIIKLINVYDQIKNLFPDPNIPEKLYYIYEVPFNLDGVIPGAKCDPLINMKVETMSSMMTTVIPDLNAISNDLNFLSTDYPINLTVISPSISFLNYTYSLTGVYELDNGDIYILDSAVNLLLTILNIFNGYHIDTLKGLLTLFFDQCMPEYPWYSRNKINSPYPYFGFLTDKDELKVAKERFISFLKRLRTGIELLREETDSQDNDIFKILDDDNNGLEGFHVGIYSFEAFDKVNPSSITTSLSIVEEKMETGSQLNLPDLLQPLFNAKKSDADKYAGITIDLLKFFNNPPSDIITILPLYVSGEGWAEFTGDNDNNSRYTEAEPYQEINGNMVKDTSETYRDLNGNGKWDEAEVFTDSDWPYGVINGRYDKPGKFYYQTEIEPFWDYGTDGNSRISSNYKLPDADGSELNNIYNNGEPFFDFNSNGKWDGIDTEHIWPNITGSIWEQFCSKCKGNMPGSLTDYPNGITDYTYLFFPDVTFGGIITSSAGFNPDGNNLYDNPDLNAAISYIHILISDILTSRKGRE